MRTVIVLLGASGAFAIAAAACSADTGKAVFGGGGSGGTGTVQGTGTGGQGGDGGDIGFDGGPGSGGSTASGSGCANDPNADGDGDGWTEVEGDCNNCDKNVNPGAVEVIDLEPDADGGPPPQVDEDCDAQIDEEELCDTALSVSDPDPLNGAKAIDICQQATDGKWGVINAAYVRADGSPIPANLSSGILAHFGQGVNVQKGQRLLALSSGNARTPLDPDPCGHSSCSNNGAGTPPPGFPAMVPGCSGGSNINDDMGLELELKAPTNASGYQFLFKFYSIEFPEYVCTTFNDQFVAIVSPPPMGALNGNITFDSANNPVSVNIAFFDVCDPNGIDNFASVCGGCKMPPDPYCPSGIAELQGNGFDGSWGDAGGTSWLQTKAPVTPAEELTIRFAIWDVGDTALDSTVVIDAFEWIAEGGTVQVGTDPVPDPR